VNRVKELRQARGFTQAELARRSGVDQRAISALETGRAKGPTLAIGLRLAEALGVEPGELIGVSPNALDLGAIGSIRAVAEVAS
jgi:transcriptional regulator with XRE-family HTH domain